MKRVLTEEKMAKGLKCSLKIEDKALRIMKRGRNKLEKK